MGFHQRCRWTFSPRNLVCSCFIILLLQAGDAANNSITDSLNYAVKESGHVRKGVAQFRDRNRDLIGSMCLLYNSQFKELPVQPTETDPDWHNPIKGQHWFTILDYRNSTLCREDFSENMTDKIVLVDGHRCEVLKQLNIALKHNASGIVIVISDTHLAISAVKKFEAIRKHASKKIWLAMIHELALHQIYELAMPFEMRMYYTTNRHGPETFIVLITISFVCIICGSVWAALVRNRNWKAMMVQAAPNEDATEVYLRWIETTRALPWRNSNGNDSVPWRNKEEKVFTFRNLCMFMITLTAAVCLILFVPHYAVYVIIVVFTVASSISLCWCLSSVLSNCQFVPNAHTSRLPYLDMIVHFRALAIYPFCAAFAVSWAIMRHYAFAWIAMDVLGFSICVLAIRVAKLPNLSMVTMLYTFLFIEEMLFTVVPPLFLRHIDYNLITFEGIWSTDDGEISPVVFVTPYVELTIKSVCFSTYQVLSFLDAISPGLLCAYTLSYDLKIQSSCFYFIASILGYLVGMTINTVCIISATFYLPPLLFYVPTMLLPIFLLAWIRNDLRTMWRDANPLKPTEGDLRDPVPLLERDVGPIVRHPENPIV